ncbi:hypothetical protein EGH21_20610 [Halomicroarcula sp. F13]|uniref:Uncharacterized protein n=1 Tax=Haloarcula rubra TaxID=2487747 RepID=A0AAW4PUS4_9EURY|nr:hypothetical protein [Halomicroarcula rubra]
MKQSNSLDTPDILELRAQLDVAEDVIFGQARTKEMMTPAEVVNPFVSGFSTQAKHLQCGGLLSDGGYVHTYE